MIVDDVFVIPRGVVIAVDHLGLFPIPQIGDKYTCGNAAWIIRGVEKIKGGCFSTSTQKDVDSYLFLVESVNGCENPMRGYILDRE